MPLVMEGLTALISATHAGIPTSREFSVGVRNYLPGGALSFMHILVSRLFDVREKCMFFSISPERYLFCLKLGFKYDYWSLVMSFFLTDF